MSFFAHGGLALLGTLLVAVPILIHLLNRRRFKVVQWGAMAFLLSAYRKTRRRLELENLLLLLLRALAVFLIAMAIARPSLSPESPLAAVAGSRRDVVIALDASYSMAYRDGSASSYERGLSAVRAILEALKPDRQDRATLLLAKQRPVRVSGPEITKVRDDLGRVGEPSFEGMDLAGVLSLAVQEIDAFAAPEGTAPEAAPPNTAGATLFLITDLQNSNFHSTVAASEPASGAQSPLRQAAAALASRKVAVRVIDVGPLGEGTPDNVGVAHIGLAEGIPAAGVPLELRAEVRNFGAAPRSNVIVTATIDGNRESPRTISLAASERREVAFPVTFRDSGDHAVEIAIDEDKLTVDDRRAFVVKVRPPLRILLVDGAPDADPELASAGMLWLALSPSEEPGALAPFTLVGGQPIERGRFASQPELIEQADVVVLANVEALSEEQATRLRDFAEAGGGVLFILGDRIDPAAYGQRLRAGNDPRRWLFPGTIGEQRAVPSREHRPWRISTLEEPVSQNFPFFEPSDRRMLLTEVPIFRFFEVDVSDEDAKGGARVLARYGDPNLSPFLVTKELGRGRVAVLTTSVDASPEKRWSLVSASVKTFIPLLFDLLHLLTAGGPDDRNPEVGRALRAEVRGFPRQATVVDPQGRSEKLDVAGSKRIGAAEEAPGGGGSADRFELPPYAATARPGIYSIEVDTTGGIGATSSVTLRFAVGVDPDEGDLTRTPATALAAALPGLDVKTAPGLVEEESSPSSEGPRNEIWKALAAAALAVLLLESALATWFGRRRV